MTKSIIFKKDFLNSERRFNYPNCEQETKIPKGLESKNIWVTKRTNAILEAMKRYSDANIQIHQQWVDELNELIIKYR